MSQYNRIASNLKRIRGAKGLSQVQVAESAGLSRSAYRSIELGKSKPRVTNLEAIARALNVPLRELLEPASELRNVRFRSRKKLRTRNQILTDVARWLDDYNGLEELLGCKRPYLLQSIAIEASESKSRPESTAHAARKALGLTDYEPIRDISGLLDFAGIKVFPMRVASDDFFGLSVGPSDGGPAVVVNVWERISVERWIFSAAHELGHLLLHLEDFGKDLEEEDPDHEREANDFAAEFLMPGEVFWREWNDAYGLPLLERVIKVKRIFRVSYRTVLHRIAPTYEGWGNIWARFQADYKRRYGRTLAWSEEPSALPGSEFSAAPETYRGREPEQLSEGDFREDGLAGLVRRAIEDGLISLGRGAEILGISLAEMRALSASWVA